MPSGLKHGARSTVDIEGEKMTVVALREIAADNLDVDSLREKIVSGQQRIAPPEEPPADEGFDAADIVTSLEAESKPHYEDVALGDDEEPAEADLPDDE
ncbi:MAG: DNA-directed RNA polymerase subunit omega [Rhodospirillales bacterium]|nr:DNA-directed RNA polymerase subunit omega [Rhodospirillales bacterium]